MKYLAFDLAPAKKLSEDDNPIASQPLGISCAATLTSDGDARVWHGPSADFTGDYAPQLSKDGCHALVDYLWEWQYRRGYTVLGWNTLGFDLNILADECGHHLNRAWVAKVALNHVDLYFLKICHQGFGTGLDTAAADLTLPGPLRGITDVQCPALWMQGRQSQDRVLKYITQNALVVARIYEALDPKNILTVAETMKVRVPDTSWIEDLHTPPLPPRSIYTDWMLNALDLETEEGK